MASLTADVQQSCVTDDGDGCSFVTPEMINDQITQLNAAYGPSNFAFNLVSREDTMRTAWCAGCD